MKFILARLIFFFRPPLAEPRGYTQRLLQGPNRLPRMSGAFSVRVVEQIEGASSLVTLGVYL